MPRFHVFLRGETASRVVLAESPAAARREAATRHPGTIRKVKLDRETVEPRNSAPRLTRREILGESHVPRR